jgi:hypothetical protein
MGILEIILHFCPNLVIQYGRLLKDYPLYFLFNKNIQNFANELLINSNFLCQF